MPIIGGTPFQNLKLELQGERYLEYPNDTELTVTTRSKQQQTVRNVFDNVTNALVMPEALLDNGGLSTTKAPADDAPSYKIKEENGTVTFTPNNYDKLTPEQKKELLEDMGNAAALAKENGLEVAPIKFDAPKGDQAKIEEQNKANQDFLNKHKDVKPKPTPAGAKPAKPGKKAKDDKPKKESRWPKWQDVAADALDADGNLKNPIVGAFALLLFALAALMATVKLAAKIVASPITVPLAIAKWAKGDTEGKKLSEMSLKEMGNMNEDDLRQKMGREMTNPGEANKMIGKMEGELLGKDFEKLLTRAEAVKNNFEVPDSTLPNPSVPSNASTPQRNAGLEAVESKPFVNKDTPVTPDVPAVRAGIRNN